MNESHTYAALNGKTWDQILRSRDPLWCSPLTVHLPVHPVHSPDFLHVDCALNVVRRRMFPNMRTGDPETARRRQEYEALVVQFALDDPPFIPDLHQSSMSLLDNRWPVARANYYAWELFYEFEYAAQAVDDHQTLLRIAVTVTNEGKQAHPAHVRARIHFPREAGFFDSHYIAYHWDRAKWEGRAEGIAYAGGNLFRNGRRFGRIQPGGWEVAWESENVADQSAFNRRRTCSERYYAHPNLRLEVVRDAIHAQTMLKGGERREFTLALLVNDEGITSRHLEQLDAGGPGSGRDASVSHFQAQIPEPVAVVEGQAGRYDVLVSYLPLNTLQLLVDFKDGTGLMPTQGGGDERFYVWVWEAMCMLRPMLALGYFEPVRKSLDFIFSLQDGGCPPSGEFTSLSGAIGTTGPRWLNATGSALGLAAEYAALSNDPGFWNDYLPKMLKAGDWLMGEIRATRKFNADGTRPITYGLLPFGHGTDGDVGYAVSLSDAYSLWGLDALASALEKMSHPRAGDVRAETERYRRDLGEAISRLSAPDGFIDRKIVTGRPDENYAVDFEHVCGAINYVATNALSAGSDLVKKYMAYFEAHQADGYFTGRMNRDVVYIGCSDALWHEAWLRVGEWKKAFVVMQAVIRYGMSQDTFQTQERFSRRDPGFTCWQPNGSGNGRLLGMILRSFYYEYKDEQQGDVVLVLGGLPWAWLKDNGTTALRNLRTRSGLVNVEVVPAGGDSGFMVTLQRATAAGVLLRFPVFMVAVPCSSSIQSEGKGFFRVSSCLQQVVFKITEAADQTGN